MSSYEELRNKNIEDNKRILAELGILNPFRALPRVQVKRTFKRKRVDDDYVPETKKQKYLVKPATNDKDLGTDFSSGRRRSSRIKGDAAPDVKDIEDEVEKETEAEREAKERRKSLLSRPMVYGANPDVAVGTWWLTRIECNRANIHRPPVSGIHAGPEGAYSIALSGGYEDDIDMGDCFTYTGEGGRDLTGTANKPKNLRTAPQSKDQCLSRGNASLVASVETKTPVRVLRGYKLPSAFAPEDGYRYDGLYRVEKYWFTTGLAGFGVYKFALKRLLDQAPPPWEIMDTENNNTTKENNEISVLGQSDSKDVDLDASDSGIESQSSQQEVMDDNIRNDGEKSESMVERESTLIRETGDCQDTKSGIDDLGVKAGTDNNDVENSSEVILPVTSDQTDEMNSTKTSTVQVKSNLENIDPREDEVDLDAPNVASDLPKVTIFDSNEPKTDLIESNCESEVKMPKTLQALSEKKLFPLFSKNRKAV